MPLFRSLRDPNGPIPGVVYNGNVEKIDDEKGKGICLDWEEHLLECAGECAHCHCNHGGMKAVAGEDQPGCTCGRWYAIVDGQKRWTNEDCKTYLPRGEYQHEHCGPGGTGEYLIGSWRRTDEGLYEPDLNSPDAEYAAIAHTDSTTVVWSKCTKKVALIAVRRRGAPREGNLDCPSAKGVDAYDLPESVYGSREHLIEE